MAKLGVVWVLLFIFVLISSISFADTTYPYPSNTAYDFQTGTGLMNEVEEDNVGGFDVYSESVNNPEFMPLVEDLDGDGTNEIIILDGDSIEVWQNIDLDKIDSITTSADTRPYMITYDIDGDTDKEIIVSSAGSTNIEIFGFNGSILTLENTLVRATGTGETMLACMGTDDCVIVFTETFSCSDSKGIWGQGFSSTDVGTELELDNYFQTVTLGCLPRIPVIAVDNVEEYYVISYYMASRSDDEIHILWFNSTNLNVSLIRNLDISENFWEQQTFSGSPCSDSWTFGQTCAGDGTRIYGDGLSSPLLMDIDSSGDDEKEVVIGVMIDNDEFGMLSYNEDGNNIDSYPALFDADGQIVSNPMRATAFVDEGRNDAFCVMGLEADVRIIDLLCGSEEETYGIAKAIEYKAYTYAHENQPWLTSDLWNISNTYGKWNVLTQTAQHSGTQIQGHNLNEIVNSYGVWKLNYDCSFSLITKCLQLTYRNPVGDGVMLSVDYEQADAVGGREDLILLETNSLNYIDDKYENKAGEIIQVKHNPCEDATWKINTTVTVTVKVKDREADDVSSKVILYADDTNAQFDEDFADNDGWSINVSSESPVTFSFIANKSIGVGYIRVFGRDVNNMETIHTVDDIPFSVSSEGLEFGDCETTIDYIPSYEGVDEELIGGACVSDEDCGSSSCIGGVCVAQDETLPVIAMQEASEIFNIGITALWIMFMLALALGIWFAPVGKTISFFDGANARFAVILIGETFMLILGTMFGFIPLAIIITIIILSIVALSVWLVKKFTGVST